jgi:hypothetical protein
MICLRGLALQCTQYSIIDGISIFLKPTYSVAKESKEIITITKTPKSVCSITKESKKEGGIIVT